MNNNNNNNSVMMYTKFDATALSCGEVTKNRVGGNQVSLKYNENKRIIMQTPVMTVPFGLSEFTPENNAGPVKYSLDVSFKGSDTNPKVEQFMSLMKSVDTKMITLAVENSKLWFGKQMSKEVVEELYRPLIKESKTPEKYAPTMKIKIRPSRNGEAFNMEAFTSDKEPFDMAGFQAGSTVKCIVDFSPVWFVNKQFGLTLNLMQMEIVGLPSGKLQGFAFQSDDDLVSDEEDEHY
jgi:hypothetical protein